MATICLLDREFLIQSSYAGPEGSYLEEQENNSVQEICRDSYYKQCESDLSKIVISCNERGWDGYDALPISAKVIEITSRLIKKMGILGFQNYPELVPENDGAITLEWYVNPKQELSVSVNPNNVLYHAFIDGSDKRHGSSIMQEGLSPSIIALIDQIMDN